MSNIQDLEQEVLLCWGITEDLLLLANEHEEDGNLSMQILGIKEVYEMRFSKAWDTYEKVVAEHYAWKPREVNFELDNFDLDDYPDNSKDA
jgi:ribonucleotide reductase beta subunit family protein with ferritin-like domain